MKSPGTAYLLSAALAALTVVLASCEVGPNYERPKLDVPEKFKSPADDAAAPSHLGQDWWLLFGDETLTRLVTEASAANPNLKAAMERVEESRQAALAVKSQFYPSIAFNPSVVRSRTPAPQGGGAATSGKATAPKATLANLYSIPFDISYEVDIWGRVRRSFESATAQFRASAYDAEVVRQTLLADVAADYFTLRSLDAQAQILARNVELYRKQVELTETQFKTGMADQTSLYQARTLLDSTLAQLTDIRRQRADEEHALAILVGKPPSEIDLPARPLNVSPPVIPAGLPVELLRRRPDVAESEQNLIAASAQVGVAQAGFLPTVTLTGVGGFEGSEISHVLEWSRRDWSLGAGASQPVFEGGLLTADLRQAEARYRELSATYRSTVLVAFGNVEDALNDIHHLADEARCLDRAVQEAREYLRLAEIQYKQGMVTYLIVIDAERTLLTNELAQAQTLNQQMTATVLLIKAVGGGWDTQAAIPQVSPK